METRKSGFFFATTKTPLPARIHRRYAAALNPPEMTAHPAGLIGAAAGAEGLRIQGAVGALGHAVALDQVGVELLAAVGGEVPPFGVFLVVFVLGLGVGCADVA